MKSGVVVEAKTKKYHLRYWDSLTWAAKRNRKQETESEQILWELLRKRRLGYKFTRQKPIGRFVADFLKCCGIKTLRFKDSEVYNNIDEVENRLEKYIRTSPVPPRAGRQGEVTEGRRGLETN